MALLQFLLLSIFLRLGNNSKSYINTEEANVKLDYICDQFTSHASVSMMYLLNKKNYISVHLPRFSFFCVLVTDDHENRVHPKIDFFVVKIIRLLTIT